MDAGAFGARLGPADAFRFAKGNEVTSNSGQPVRLSRPLDFLVVADHSDGFGFFPLIVGGDPAVTADPQGRKWNEIIHSGQGADAALDIIRNFGTGPISKAIMPDPGTAPYRGAWQKAVKAAEEANEPGRFTAFIGFEWTSNTGGNNLHRNVIFRDDASKALPVEPYTTMKLNRPGFSGGSEAREDGTRERRGRYPEQVKERSVRLVFEQAPSHPSQREAIESIARKMGCTAETLPSWARQAERDAGKRAGLTTTERERRRSVPREPSAHAPVDFRQPSTVTLGASPSVAVRRYDSPSRETASRTAVPATIERS